jgi:hypothetical protein
MIPELERQYAKYQQETRKFGELMIEELQRFIDKPKDEERPHHAGDRKTKR